MYDNIKSLKSQKSRVPSYLQKIQKKKNHRGGGQIDPFPQNLLGLTSFFHKISKSVKGNDAVFEIEIPTTRSPL